MKLNDLNKQEVAVRALKENFEVNLNVKGLNKIQTQTMHNKVKGLIAEAKESKNFGAEYPSYMKLVFMEQALSEHYKVAPSAPRTKVITEKTENSFYFSLEYMQLSIFLLKRVNQLFYLLLQFV